jgi:hypothetical protein
MPAAIREIVSDFDIVMRRPPPFYIRIRADIARIGKRVFEFILPCRKLRLIEPRFARDVYLWLLP